jgi:HAD superfamily hydrolase (TIGR01509 family)
MTPGQRVRLITIDLDDTLWPCAPVIGAAEAALYAWLAANTPRLTEVHDPLSLREHRRALMSARPEIAHDLTTVRLLALRTLMQEFRYSATLADEAMALFRQQRNRVEPYPDVLPALERLRIRCRLVSVTNGNAEVRATPLRDCFHHSLTAADAGAAKPDPALFALAMQWTGATVADTVHVGDDPERDVEAAHRAGLSAVWVNRAGQEWPDDLAPPDIEVADLLGLADWLELDPTTGGDHAV